MWSLPLILYSTTLIFAFSPIPTSPLYRLIVHEDLLSVCLVGHLVDHCSRCGFGRWMRRCVTFALTRHFQQWQHITSKTVILLRVAMPCTVYMQQWKTHTHAHTHKRFGSTWQPSCLSLSLSPWKERNVCVCAWKKSCSVLFLDPLRGGGSQYVCVCVFVWGSPWEVYTLGQCGILEKGAFVQHVQYSLVVSPTFFYWHSSLLVRHSTVWMHETHRFVLVGSLSLSLHTGVVSCLCILTDSLSLPFFLFW
jgi:hypothetical protein